MKDFMVEFARLLDRYNDMLLNEHLKEKVWREEE